MRAVQSNLEQLINRSRTNPHPRRSSDAAEPFHGRHSHTFSGGNAPAHPSHLNPSHDQTPPSPSEPAAVPSSRRQSAYAHTSDIPRIGTIREASYDDGAAILLGDEDEDTERDERTSLLKAKREPRRQSYGATSEPIGWKGDYSERSGRRRSDARGAKIAGSSRSRSKARTPPRRDPVPQLSTTETISPEDNQGIHDVYENGRGRGTEERPLSPVSTRYSGDGHKKRRESITTRFADDSSGDEGGDVARGLVATGGGAVFGGRSGMGMTPGGASGPGAVMDLDPAEELDAEDLELPIADDGLEARDWTEAMRVSRSLGLFSSKATLMTRTKSPLFCALQVPSCSPSSLNGVWS